nr:hypothetical protein [Salmonella enterica subsp. enterica serovar Rissen]
MSDARRNSYFDADSRANRKQSSHTDRTERQSNRQALDWGDTPFLFRPGLSWLNMPDWVKSGRCERILAAKIAG